MALTVAALDDARLPELMEWSHWFFYLLTVIPSQQARIQIDHALERLRHEFADLVAVRRAAPGEDFISYLLASDDLQQVLDDDRLIDNLILLFIGLETASIALYVVAGFTREQEQRSHGRRSDHGRDLARKGCRLLLFAQRLPDPGGLGGEAPKPLTMPSREEPSDSQLPVLPEPKPAEPKPPPVG